MKNISVILFLFSSFFSFAQSQTDSTKQQYHLFNPAPREQMRGFETDRPDLTESAYTVDAGHFQLETDLFATARSSVNGIKSTQNSFNVFNLKFGLTNSLDIHLIAETFVDEGSSGTTSSFGSFTIRAKQNIWGNDQGKTALAILPYVNIPTVSGEKVSGGLVVPFGMSLANDWGFGTQVQFDFVEDEIGNNSHLNFSASAVLAHPLIGNIDFFVETLIARESELKITEYFLNGGVVYKLSENVKFDAGVNYGLKEISPKIYFVGFSFRI